MANERITEEIVRDHFKSDPLFKTIRLEEQRSTNRKIVELLKTASKLGTGKLGKPEFLITFPTQSSNYIIVVECKPDISKHQSPKLNSPKDFAVDGVLHYARFLKREFNVIAIAVSGDNKKELLVSTFYWPKAKKSYSDEKTDKLISINDYIKLFNNEAFVENLKNIDIIQKAVYLNEEFHSLSITENTRCTVVSALLLGLLDNAFKKSYATYERSLDLAEGLLQAINRVIKKDNVRNKESLISEFEKITNEPLFKQDKIKQKKQEILTISKVKDFIDYLYSNVYPLMSMDIAGMDILGKFYTEFIRYAGSSQKQGLVLTPFHVTDFFCELANITVNNIVYDPCCGTGGFLIAAMKRMLKLAGSDGVKKDEIKSSQLVGIERRSDMFTYACSNMLFRGDGKSNVYNKDCFNIGKLIEQEHRPDVAFLNPPYDVGVVGQMEFIEHSLSVVTKTNGIVIGIVQMSCALKNEKALVSLKERLLKKHRLKAVISMPDDLFYPIGVVTCIMVWEANKPNKGYDTWFGYLMDDGYEKRKHKGRIDVKDKWKDIKENFIKIYRNQKEVEGLSVKKEVTAKESWLAQSYLETDYNLLTQRNFEDTIRNYLSFLMRTKYIDISSDPIIKEKVSLDTSNWKYHSFDKVFLAIKGKRLTKEDMFDGETPYVSSSCLNNGVECYISENPIFTGTYLSFACYGSIGEVFYHSYDAWVSDNCNVLYLQEPYEMNVYNAMFLCAVLGLEKYRFGYGYTGKLGNINRLRIKLPTNSEDNPDFKFMEKYIKSLPYSASIE